VVQAWGEAPEGIMTSASPIRLDDRIGRTWEDENGRNSRQL
jgi:hypothetical protein